MEEIGKRLRALREGVRLTQVNMAEILGVQQSRINRYETGQSTPAPEIFIKYADYFNVSMDYLYCRTDEPRGKLYDYQPQALKEKTEQSREMREFIEMCFDPHAPVNKRLKEALLRLMTELVRRMRNESCDLCPVFQRQSKRRIHRGPASGMYCLLYEE